MSAIRYVLVLKKTTQKEMSAISCGEHFIFSGFFVGIYDIQTLILK